MIRTAALAFLLIFALADNISAQRPKQQSKPRSQNQSRNYEIDLAQSHITVTLTQEGLIARRYPTHRIEVKKFSGKIVMFSSDESKISAELIAESDSLINVDQDMSEFERKEFQNILNVSVVESGRFPQIKFVSVAISDVKKSGETRSFTLNGDLTLHGVTKRVSLPISVTMGGDQLRARGETRLKQSDFAMKPYTGGLGLIKIGDELKVSFELAARAIQR